MRIEQILNDFFNSYSLLVLLACVLVALGFLIRATVKLRGEIERIDFDDSDPSSIGAKLREITLNYEEYRSKATRRLIFKVDPNTFIIDYLKTSFERTYWYRAGSIFTGISLMLTFFLIGVAVHKIGMSLPAIAEKKDLMSLGQPIAHLQQKFYVLTRPKVI
ncbi:MAG: hypothetical protein IT288_00495 [Bdellovibrionales bacterium]|nr:hypothetical protein [Bdellovibrionales bacterium]